MNPNANPLRVVDWPDEEFSLCLECGLPTSESKPYCSQHVELMPYVSDLMATLTGDYGLSIRKGMVAS